MSPSTKCSLDAVYALIAAAIAACAAAVIAGVAGYPYVALVAALVAFGLVIAIGILFDNYKQCCDSESGPSECSTSNINNALNAIRVSLGIAVVGYLAAIGLSSIPYVGEYLSSGLTSAVTYAGTVIAAGMLAYLITLISAYKTCRKR
ncbi:MAG: hypothetical protein ACOY8P_02125 [Thermodesulfobacteriota bacterium]|jgi:hypothetical protein